MRVARENNQEAGTLSKKKELHYVDMVGPVVDSSYIHI